MSRKKNLIKNTAVISLGSFFPKFITLFLTPILTANLTKAEYGQYDLITTIVSLLLPAVTIQIGSAAFRFLIDQRNNRDECKDIISTITTFVSFTSVVACAFYYIFYGHKLGINGIIVCLYFLADILLIAFQQMMRGLGKNIIYSVSIMVRSVVDVFLVILFLGVIGERNLGLTGVLIAMTISTTAGLILIALWGGIISLFDIRKISFSRLKELLNYSWPMVPNNLSSWVLRLSDRLVITAALGIEANAVYAVANKMPVIFSTFQTTFSQAWQENASIASKDSDKDTYYTQMCNWVFRLMIGLMAGLIMVTPIIWKILIKGDYDEAYYQLPVLYLGILFSCFSATIGGIYIAHMRTKSIGITTIIAAMINLTIDIVFVRIIGIWAGSFSTMVSYLFLVVYRMIDVQKFQKIHFEIKTIIGGVAFLAIMGCLMFSRTIICYAINVIICGIVLFLFDRQIINNMFSAIFAHLRSYSRNQ